MIGNKDEAERCLRIALGYINEGNYVQGKKLLIKAKRMHPDLNVDQYIRVCDESIKNNYTETNNTTNCNTTYRPQNANNVIHRNRKPTTLIDKILQTNNYYDILGVPTNSNDDTIKAAYKKLAKQLHPDKNKEKGAEEAFKKVSKAFQNLSNKEKRYLYDNNMGEEAEMIYRTPRYQPSEEIFTPEEFIRNLFGVNFACHTRTYNRTNQNYANRNYSRNGNYNRGNPDVDTSSQNFTLMQIFTFIVMAIILFISTQYEPPKSIYSLQKTNHYDTINYTSLNNIRFYTKRSFNYLYPRNSDSRFQVEFEVEYKYYENECKMLSQKMIKEYKKDRSKYKNASKNRETPESCIKLNHLEEEFNKYIMKLRRK